MTKKFRPNQCPTCQYNNDNYACMNSKTVYPSGSGSHVDWTPFKGTTNGKCGRYKPREKEKQK